MKTWFLAGLLWPAAVYAAGAPSAELTLTDAWVDPAAAGARTFVHGVLTNTTSDTVTVGEVASPVGESARIQLYRKDATGLLQVEPLPRLLMAPHGSRVMVPGALELEITGLKTDLEEGTEIPLTLTTASGSRTYRLPVGQPHSAETESARP